MKDLKDCLINESSDDVERYIADALSTDNKTHYPIFKFPDGKEYVLQMYDSKHARNGQGEYHEGLEFVEFKDKRKDED